jgi:MFS family permease
MGAMLRPRSLFISACAGILVFGIVLAILGAVLGLPAVRERLHINLSQQGTLFLLLYLGIFCASLIVGPLIDFVGNKANLFVSSAIVSAAMVWFALGHSFGSDGLAAVLLGLGGGGLNICANALVSDVYGDERGPMLNLLGIFFGIGAICVPVLAASIEGHFTIPQLFSFCAVLAAICALGVLMLFVPQSPERGRAPVGSDGRAAWSYAGIQQQLASAEAEQNGELRLQDPEVVASYRQNLALVDNLIGVCQKSVDENPDDEMARDYLLTAYQQKADLLSALSERDALGD